MAKLKHSLPIAITFIWLGFVCAISFMEAPAKFTAPHLSLQVGVEVGRIVFMALNRVEIILALFTLGFAFINGYGRKTNILISILLGIVAIQTFWLLPTLHQRVQLIIDGQTPTPSKLHLYYISSDVLKVICLIGLGIGQFGHFREKCLERFFIKESE
ncbi:hypothetical protein [Solitalea canadensis]|uniref:DUF4149 domain-containing protein n=1 Tax=Solitalea canadensis (strain ATCC 29591 / DSM 3403 / JCM 21819 / LMG 8368 / NBRC 15130 / NCIMB 12057 / USAM 9D) TaxID=929556 RepID=H8KRX4_SOLCM|nr:hypothetical protein [Solitalea canadensis]AFD07762.1 hypothetical protein Solca_2729 [Solitalea canadensis DSM 3403]